MVLFQDLKRHIKNFNNKSKPLGVLQIRTAAELLDIQDNQVFLQTIKLLIKPSRRFDNFYLPVIEKFAEFVQNIPENEHGFFCQQTDFLSHGLERSSRVLSLCLAYFFPKQTDFSAISDHDALWIYATFTAALFLDIGKIAVKYTIMLYHAKAYPLKKWDPYTGAMLGQGSYYKFDYVKENFNNLRHFITPMLARQVLDSVESSAEKGFNWIASDPEVLEIWFALLIGEEGRIPMASFMSMIPQAEIEIIENYRKKMKLSLSDPAGEAFLQWLRKEIKKKRIHINDRDNKLQVREKEVILSSVLFQQFANTNSTYKHPAVIERQFIDIAKLYQIPISELDQRSRAHGGVSGMSDLAKRYRTMGGIAAIQENEKTSHRFFKGGIGLLALIISLPSRKIMISSGLTEKSIIKAPISPKPST